MSISKTILIGTLGQDPEFRQMNNGKSVASFSLATNKTWKNQAGEKQQKTTWHNITCFDPLSKVCQYLAKGSKIYLEGELDYQKYTNKDGVEKDKTVINAQVIDIIKGKDREERGVDAHNQAKGNAYQPQKEEDDSLDDICPF